MTEQRKQFSPSKKWHVVMEGSRRGPYSAEELSDFIYQDKISGKTLVWTEGMSQWETAQSIPDLAPLFEEPVPPPIPVPNAVSEKEERIAETRDSILRNPLVSEKPADTEGAFSSKGNRPLLRPYEREDSQIKGIVTAVIIAFLIIVLAAAGITWFYKASRASKNAPGDQLAQTTETTATPAENLNDLASEEKEIEALVESADRGYAAGKWQDAITSSGKALQILEDKSKGAGKADFPDPDELKKKWAKHLHGTIAEGKLSRENVFRIGAQCLAWDPSLKKKVGEAYLAQAAKYLRGTGKTSLSDGVALLQEAAALNPSLSVRAGDMVWRELSERLYNPQGFNQSTFTKLYNLGHQFGLSQEVKAQPTYRLAQSLKHYKDGNKIAALAELQSLSNQSSDPAAMRFARQILAPPKNGSRVFQAEPFVMKDAQDKDALVITPASMRISQGEIQLSFRVRNASDRRQGLLFAKRSAGQSVGGTNELLQIEDDLGKKFFAEQGFTGGRQRAYDRSANLWLIEFEPKEDTAIAAAFPMISPGATQIKFLSPQYGGQSSWWWSNIRVKEDPFEPPLKPVLVADRGDAQSAAKPTAAPVGTATPLPAEPSPGMPLPDAQTMGDGGMDTSIPDLEPTVTQAPPDLPETPELPAADETQDQTDLNEIPNPADSEESEDFDESQTKREEFDEALAEDEDQQEAAEPEEQVDEYYERDELAEQSQAQQANDIRDLETYRQAAQQGRESFIMLRVPRSDRYRHARFEIGEEFYGRANQARIRRNYIAATAYYKEAAKAYREAARGL